MGVMVPPTINLAAPVPISFSSLAEESSFKERSKLSRPKNRREMKGLVKYVGNK